MSTTVSRGSTDARQIRARLIAASRLTERREELAGVSTAFLEGGDGDPIVLLHGQGEFWAVWLAVIPELTATHHVIVADLPGHGESLESQRKLDAHGITGWVDELIRATCDAPPVLVGHLLGGAIAARYATEHSERLGHLVLVDTMGLGWYRPSPRFAIPMLRFVLRPTPQARDRLFRECFVDFDQVGDRFGERWDDLRDYALDRARTAQNKAALKDLMPHVGVPAIPPDDLAGISVPTTLIHGRHDLQVPLKAAEKASRRFGWPLYVIDGARDDPAAEQPEAFVEALHRALVHGRDRGRKGSPS